MKTKHLTIVTLIGLAALQACQGNHKTTAESTHADSVALKDAVTDTSGINRGADYPVFIKSAAEAGLMEIGLSQVALEKSSNPKVKEFAQQVITEHGKITSGLKQLADEKKIALPTTLPAAGAAHIEEMKKMSGADFDKHYMGMMVKDHIKMLDLFKSASTLGDTPTRSFAGKTLTKLEGHYKMATDLNDALK
jgi:putative membrane protein